MFKFIVKRKFEKSYVNSEIPLHAKIVLSILTSYIVLIFMLPCFSFFVFCSQQSCIVVVTFLKIFKLLTFRVHQIRYSNKDE